MRIKERQSMNKKRKGYTLIKLLIVVVVIAVLAVVVFITLNPVKRMANLKNTGSIPTSNQF
jgi:prepilin-type N-terminal cleavage/methylation domain-containing protein